MPDSAPSPHLLTEIAQRLAAQEAAREELVGKLEQAERERDEYRRVYLALLEAYRKLEAGLFGQKRERFLGAQGQEQLALSLLEMMTGQSEPVQPEATPQKKQKVEAHERNKPTGRKPLPEHLPRIEVEVMPPEVQREGLEAFERIGEDVSEVLEHRPSSFVVVRTVRPKFVLKVKREEKAVEPSSPETPPEVASASLPAETESQTQTQTPVAEASPAVSALAVAPPPTPVAEASRAVSE